MDVSWTGFIVASAGDLGFLAHRLVSLISPSGISGHFIVDASRSTVL